MSKQTVKAYNEDPAFKAAFLAEIGAHERADALIKGSYSQLNGQFKGCAIGCALHSLHTLQGTLGEKHPYDDHGKVAADLGWPLWLAYLEDHLFESLPNELSKTWPRRLAEAVPVGAVITDAVLAKILVWSLTADTFGVIHATEDTEVKGWIKAIADGITTEADETSTAEQREAASQAARDAWDAWAARAARAARAAETREAFYPALSEFVLSVLRELPSGSL